MDEIVAVARSSVLEEHKEQLQSVEKSHPQASTRQVIEVHKLKSSDSSLDGDQHSSHSP